jgi:hypothetical protein
MLHCTIQCRWNYAIDIGSLRFKRIGPLVPGAAAFNHTNWPVVIEATVREVEWGMYENSAAEPPQSPACVGANSTKCGAPTSVLLVPHGGTDLRIGELPVTGL